MGKNQFVNLPGILNRAEVGRLILLNVHGTDLYFIKFDSVILHSQQHIGFVFETLTLDGAQDFQIGTGNDAQTGLGIGEGHTHENLKDGGSGLVAKTASGRHMIQREVTAAQCNAAGFQHFFAAAARVLGMVLVVTVHRDHTETIGPVCQEVAEGVLQRGTLALIDLVVQQVNDIGMCGSFGFKVVKIFGLAAVVDQNDVRKAILQKTVDDRVELLIGIQRGQDNGDFR